MQSAGIQTDDGFAFGEGAFDFWVIGDGDFGREGDEGGGAFEKDPGGEADRGIRPESGCALDEVAEAAVRGVLIACDHGWDFDCCLRFDGSLFTGSD